MNREDWLKRVAEKMAPWFAELGHPLPAYRAAIGFTSKGMRSKAIGQCWAHTASKDGVCEIFIVPTLEEPMRIADVLAHELVHAAVGLEAKHGPVFGKAARAIGLEGKLTATVGGVRFIERAKPILDEVGPLPHAALTNDSLLRSSAPKKQSTRQLKCSCATCGYTVRVTRKWLEIGAPICPQDGVPMCEDQ
jgi:hypothetical protein